MVARRQHTQHQPKHKTIEEAAQNQNAERAGPQNALLALSWFQSSAGCHLGRPPGNMRRTVERPPTRRR